jgi:hypothetical protein
MSITFPAELNLLLCCVRTVWHPDETEQLRQRLAQGIDWNRYVQLAVRHRVAALVYKNLRDLHDDRVPETVLAELRRHLLANIQSSLRLGVELAEIVKVFRAHGIAAVPFKGLVLAAEFYDPPELRPAGDLDIIVNTPDVDRAMALLTGLGFRSELESLNLNAVQSAAYRKVAHGFQFFHEDKAVNLDLHWRFANRFQDLPIDFQRIERHLRTIRVLENEVPTLGLQDMIQYLCYHGQENYWEQLGWIGDIAAFLCRHADWDWGGILEDAERLNNRHRLLLGVWIAYELLGSPLPEPLSSCLAQDRRIPVRAELIYAGLARRARESASTPSSLVRLRDAQTRLRLAQGLRAKLEAVLEPVFSPRPADFSAMPLPAPLFPLYYLLRPLRLIGKYGRALIRSPR